MIAVNAMSEMTMYTRFAWRKREASALTPNARNVASAVGMAGASRTLNTAHTTAQGENEANTR